MSTLERRLPAGWGADRWSACLNGDRRQAAGAPAGQRPALRKQKYLACLRNIS